MNRYVMSVAVLTVTGSVCAQAVQWTQAEGGNGHWYVSTTGPANYLSWEDARILAEERGGYLVCTESFNEHAWLSQTYPMNDTSFWLGLYQDLNADDYSEPDGGWYWLTGESLDFENWNDSEPNNSNGGIEHVGSAFHPDHKWNDAVGSVGPAGPNDCILIIEYSSDCNDDGIVDYGQILDGTYADDDGNGVPDCCDAGEPCDDGTAPEGHGWSIEPVQWSEAEGGNGHWYATMCFTEDCAEPLFYEFWPREQYVESVGGHLVTPTSAAEYAFMAQHGFGGHFGGYQDMDAPDFSEPNGGWRWVTGEPFEWTNWGSGEPNNGGGTEHFVGACCGGDAGTWNDVSTLAWEASVEFEADCNGDGIVDYGQILDGTYADDDGNGVPDCCDAGEPCDDGTAPEGHGWSIEPVQWSEAEGGNGHWYATMCFTEDCAEPLFYEFWPREQYVESVGGHLVTPTSAAEYAFMAQHGFGGHFGGYQDMDAPDFSEPNGGWRWVTGEPFEWTNWGSGEPNNGGGTEHFVGACCGGDAGTWNDVSTLAWEASVEFEADCNGDGIVDYGQILDGTYADDDGNGVPDCCDAGEPCDDGTAPEGHGWSIEPVQWSEAEGGNGHWYATMCFTEDCAEPLFYEFWPREQYVESVGGHLVTPTSAAEYAFMAQHGFGGHFGGYQDMDAPDFSEPNGGWRWVTGEPFEWTNWGSGEPNNGGGTEHFVGACCGGDAGTWNDVSTLAWEASVEFEADCNGDGIVDYGQIIDGTFEDADGNGVPDCCDDDEPCFPCPGDIVGNDGVVGVDDLLYVIAAYGQTNVPADLNGDGVVDVQDILLILEYWGDCP